MLVPRILSALARSAGDSVVFEAVSLATVRGGFAGLRWQSAAGRVYIDGLGWFSSSGACVVPVRHALTRWRLWSVSVRGVYESVAILGVEDVDVMTPELSVPAAEPRPSDEPCMPADPVVRVPQLDVCVAEPALNVPGIATLSIDPPVS
ncbi:MAG: hypothetical protein AAF654_04955 [Myxococcota bacterium]